MKTNRFVAGSGATPAHIGHALLRSGLSIGALRALSPLEENAQRMVDQAVVKVGLERLTVAADLLSRGLTRPLPNPLSVMELQWEQVSKSGGAQRTMSPSARGEFGQADRRPKRVPIYLTTDDFSINIRTLLTSQRLGQPIDTDQVMEATRRVNEAIEDAAINGTNIQADGYGTYGLLNAPNANTKTLTGSSWSTATGAEIVTDVLNMIGQLQADLKFGPYCLYVGTVLGMKLENDYSTVKGEGTIRERLEKIDAGGKLTVKVADKMPAATAVVVQMTSDVIDMITGQAPTVIPWTSADGFTLHWMVMAIMVPRVRDDYDGNSGVVIGT